MAGVKIALLLVLGAQGLVYAYEGLHTVDGVNYHNEAYGVRAYEREYEVKSYNYPQQAMENLIQTWRYVKYQVQEPAVFRLQCFDINIPKSGNSCGDYKLIIDDGKQEEVICGSVAPFTRDYQVPELNLKLYTGSRAGGVVKCSVEVFPVDSRGQIVTTTTTTTTTTKAPPSWRDIPSEEVRSQEHGVAPGRVTPTCNCGWRNRKDSHSNTRIVSGEETGVNEFPWVVALVGKGSVFPFCGGSIITQWHVLSAAHCTQGSSANDMSVVIGEHDWTRTDETNSTQVINVARIVQHGDYKEFHFVDIVLLELERQITFTQFVGPVCLPTAPIDLARKYVKVIGWGKVVHQGPASPVLKHINVRALPSEQCSYGWGIPKDRFAHLCVYGHKKSSCQGDSGGPNVYLDPETNRYTLVGLVSYGSLCAGDMPIVNTLVSSYLDWIDHFVKATRPEAVMCTKP